MHTQARGAKLPNRHKIELCGDEQLATTRVGRLQLRGRIRRDRPVRQHTATLLRRWEEMVVRELSGAQ